MAKWASEPWTFGPSDEVRGMRAQIDAPGKFGVALASSSENAARICAAVNACAGLSNAALEAGAIAELLAACESTLNWLSSFSMPPTSTIAEKEASYRRLEAAIAKIKES